MSSQKLSQRLPLVGGRIVQQDDDPTAQMAQQLPKKQANFLLPDIVEVKLIVQAQVLSAGTYGDSGNDRDLVAASLAMIVNRSTTCGDHVLTTCGIKRKPDSPAKTRWAPNRAAFFLFVASASVSSARWPRHFSPGRAARVSVGSTSGCATNGRHDPDGNEFRTRGRSTPQCER